MYSKHQSLSQNPTQLLFFYNQPGNYNVCVLYLCIRLSHLFFSSSSLLAFFLNLGKSCCSSSLAVSLSLSALLSLEKWNVVLSPVWRTSWSWILALPSGLIFWPTERIVMQLGNTHIDLTFSTTSILALHCYALTADICILVADSKAVFSLWTPGNTISHQIKCAILFSLSNFLYHQ